MYVQYIYIHIRIRVSMSRRTHKRASSTFRGMKTKSEVKNKLEMESSPEF